MKIFISWSGDYSLKVATALKESLPTLFNGIDLFVSEEDIRKGKRWLAEVSKELEQSKFGIACLTPDNLDAPWLHFETGALSKFLKDSSLWTLLVGNLRFGDIHGPLEQFQHTVFEKEDFFKLLKSINEAHGENKQQEARLWDIFDGYWWEKLEANITKIAPQAAAKEKKRTTDEMLYQLLETTNQIARTMPNAQGIADLATVNATLTATQKDLLMRQEENQQIYKKLNQKDSHIKDLQSELQMLKQRLDFLHLYPSASDDFERKQYADLPDRLRSSLKKLGISSWRQLSQVKRSDLLKAGIADGDIQRLILICDKLAIQPPADA